MFRRVIQKQLAKQLLNGLLQDGCKWLFGVKFFSFKSAWIFACAFQFSRKTFSCIFFLLKYSCSAFLCSLCTLQYFVFVFLRNKEQTSQKSTGGCCTTKLRSTCKNPGTFEGKKIAWKSQLHLSCTKPFNCWLLDVMWVFMWCYRFPK